MTTATVLVVYSALLIVKATAHGAYFQRPDVDAVQLDDYLNKMMYEWQQQQRQQQQQQQRQQQQQWQPEVPRATLNHPLREFAYYPGDAEYYSPAAAPAPAAAAARGYSAGYDSFPAPAWSPIAAAASSSNNQQLEPDVFEEFPDGYGGLIQVPADQFLFHHAGHSLTPSAAGSFNQIPITTPTPTETTPTPTKATPPSSKTTPTSGHTNTVKPAAATAAAAEPTTHRRGPFEPFPPPKAAAAAISSRDSSSLNTTATAPTTTTTSKPPVVDRNRHMRGNPEFVPGDVAPATQLAHSTDSQKRLVQLNTDIEQPTKEQISHLRQHSMSDIYFIVTVTGLCVLIVGITIGGGFCYQRVRRRAKDASDSEYPAYGVTGPKKELSPTSGDRKLAQSAQMYHYQHQKQQMMAMEKSHTGRLGSASDVDSEDEVEEGEYTVYECPGLAPSGEMEVKNPLFHDDPTPANVLEK